MTSINRIVEPVEGWPSFLGRPTVIWSDTRVVEPVQGWGAFLDRGWGVDDQLVQDWFDAGEVLQFEGLDEGLE